MSQLKAYRGHTVFPWCPACGFEGVGLVVVDLIARYGEETEMNAVLARCKCSGCGRVGIPRVTLSWTEQASLDATPSEARRARGTLVEFVPHGSDAARRL